MVLGIIGWLIVGRVGPRWLALVTIGMIVTLGAAGAFVALGAAERTAHAYGRYLERADVGEVVVNPSLATADIDRAIRALPGVRTVTSDALFLAWIGDDDSSRTMYELDNDPDFAALQVRGSADGRYVDMDRPVVNHGRLSTGPDEAFVTAQLAAEMHLEIGDVVPVSFWSQYDDLLAAPEDVVVPIGVERLRVVGIGTLADEVLPDDLYPRQRIIVSPDVAARYDCLFDAPPPDVTAEEGFEILLASGRRCATAYRYYAMDITGAVGVSAAVDELLRAMAELNERLPFDDVPDEERPEYFVIATTTAQEQARVDRSNQPTVAALGVLGLAAGAVTIIVVGLTIARELRRGEPDQLQWWHLGLTVRERVPVVAVPLGLVVGLGLVAALALAWLLSPVGPVGAVRSIDPNPARELSSWVVFGALGLALVGVLGVTVLALRAARRAGRAPRVPREARAVQVLIRGARRPQVAEGIRAAFASNRGAGLVVATGAVGAAAFVAATVFGASLGGVVATPAAYGWPWDLAWIFGGGYGPVELNGVDGTLSERSDVESWSALGFTSDVTLDGDQVFTVVSSADTAQHITVAEGRLPAGADEVALGARTAAERGLEVGDEVAVAGPGVRSTRATVTGLVVLPPVGPYLSDRAGLGTGMLATAAIAEEEESVTGIIAFVGIDLVPNAEPDAVLADLRPDVVAWDPERFLPFEYPEPVRPAEIINAESMRAVPTVVGGLLVVAAAGGLSLAVVLSVRSRRRELAILRALGFTGRQVRVSVHVQALATMAAALIVGTPLGIVVGRVAWRTFATQLGVVPEPTAPALWVLATVGGALVVAVMAAAVPARLAARAATAAVLRSE